MTKWTREFRKAYMKKYNKERYEELKAYRKNYYRLGAKTPRKAPRKLTKGAINWNNPLAKKLVEARYKETAWLSKDIMTRKEFQGLSAGQIVRALNRGTLLAGTTK